MRQDCHQSPADKPRYSAFLIRMWQQTPNSRWCASAQEVVSGEIMRFGSIDALLVFLGAQAESCADENVREEDKNSHKKNYPRKGSR